MFSSMSFTFTASKAEINAVEYSTDVMTYLTCIVMCRTYRNDSISYSLCILMISLQMIFTFTGIHRVGELVSHSNSGQKEGKKYLSSNLLDKCRRLCDEKTCRLLPQSM